MFLGGVALILVGIGIMIGLAICRRRNSAPPREGPDDFTTPTYVPAQRVEPRVKYTSDRRRSQRTSLYYEESRHGEFFSLYRLVNWLSAGNFPGYKFSPAISVPG